MIRTAFLVPKQYRFFGRPQNDGGGGCRNSCCSFRPTIPAPTSRTPHHGLSLVELLIIIAIIGMLVSLLMPAIQSSREAARRSSCQNQLRQVGVAMQLHHTAHGWFPTNGWGYQWVGDPDRGFGREQPGGWIFNTLPYLEQESLRNMAVGGPKESPEKRAAIAEMLQTPASGLNCPSRRTSGLLPTNDPFEPYNSNAVTMTARSDFAANGGDIYCDAKSGMTTGPASYEEAETEEWKEEFLRLDHECNGIVHPQSTVSYKDITDGTSTTYLVGEKYMQPDHYFDGRDSGDKRSLAMGANREINRWGLDIPRHDLAHKHGASSWGSIHPGGFHMAFCDGSLRVLSYEIDTDVHKKLSNRRDGEAVETSSL